MLDEVKSPKTAGAFVLWGALLDLAVFIASFAFFGGAHGPAGPMFVLGVLNGPLRELSDRLIPMERSTPSLDIALAFGVVLVSGALYGLIVGLVAVGWRRIRGRR
jgi:hypothetical protein